MSIQDALAHPLESIMALVQQALNVSFHHAERHARGGQDPILPGGPAPGNADYLVGTANANLSAEIVVGTTPGGELGGTWASPTVDATHSGSPHHTRLHAVTEVLDHSAGNWKLLYTDGSGHVIELALGADGTFLQANGAAAAPTFAALVQADIAGHGIAQHTEHANWKLFYSDGSGDEKELALGAAATFLRSAGASSAPTMAAIVAGDLPAKTATLILTARGGTPTLTSGCAVAVQNETTTNKQNYWSLDFDQTTAEAATWELAMPDGWDAGTITARFYWTATGGSGGVVWSLDGRSFADDDALDQAFGTAVSSTDTFITAGDCHISPVTAAITLGGGPVAGELVTLRVSRSPTSGSDTLTADAKLIAVLIEYTQAYTD